MADQLQLRGGTTSEHSTFTGALREVTVDTDKDVLVVHDNSTAGGHPLMAEDGSNSALALGSAGTPSLKFTGDANTGIYSPTADTVGVSTGGTERIRIDSSGNVGLGTSSPGAVLDVSGSGNIVRLGDGTNTFDVRFQGTNNWAVQLDTSTDKFNIQRNSSPLVTVASSGAVGIGTTAPNRRLEVSDATVDNFIRVNTTGSTKSGIEFASGGTVYGQLYFNNVSPYDFSLLQQYSTGSVILGTNNTERARIDSSGRLLVGTSSWTGDGLFVVEGRVGSGSSNALMQLARGDENIPSNNGVGAVGFTNNAAGTGAIIYAVADANWTSGTSHPTRLEFYTCASGSSSPTERMRINDGGTTGIRPTTGRDILYLCSQDSASSSLLYISARHTSGSMFSGTQSFVVYTNGNVQNTNNSYAGISDIKLKENIVDASSQWDDLKAIQVRNYNFKEETGHPTHTQLGLIAQEVELVSPGLVSEAPDLDAENNDLGTTTKSVNYSVLYMKAVKALQEAMERIETLEAKVAALEAP